MARLRPDEEAFNLSFSIREIAHEPAGWCRGFPESRQSRHVGQICHFIKNRCGQLTILDVSAYHGLYTHSAPPTEAGPARTPVGSAYRAG
jgi:hypothetical protein